MFSECKPKVLALPSPVAENPVADQWKYTDLHELRLELLLTPCVGHGSVYFLKQVGLDGSIHSVARGKLVWELARSL